MIALKNPKELAAMKRACQIAAGALRAGGRAVAPGVTTAEIDAVIHDYIVSKGARPNFLGYGGFKGSACISVNEELIHGIPGKRVLKEGDIVSIDGGAELGGFHGDNAWTFPVGEISDEAKALMEATLISLQRGIEAARPGNRMGDIGHAVQSYCEGLGYHVVRQYVGHGIGRSLHEPPEVPNFGRPGRGIRLLPGMTIAIEPMIAIGTGEVKVLRDGWTVVNTSGRLTAHYEHTVAITDSGPVILTLPPEEAQL